MGKRVLSSTNKLPVDLGGFPASVPNKSLYFDAAGVLQMEDRIDDATFTPVVTSANPGDLTVTYTSAVGRYDKKGKWIFCNITLSFTPSYTTATGELRISGLPFASDVNTAVSMLSYVSGTSFVWPGSTGTQLQAPVPSGQSYVNLSANKSGGGFSNVAITAYPTNTAAVIRLRGMYRSAA